ncbi:hypothetical protein Bca101_004241 [Brassica carinata]
MGALDQNKPYQGFSASRVIHLVPVRQRSTSPGRALPGLDRTQYRFGVQKRQGSFRIGENRTRMVVATTGPSCHLDYLVRTRLVFLKPFQLSIREPMEYRPETDNI